MQWYYSKNGTQLGPVAQSELIAKLVSGEVSGSDLVWKDGMADWIPASQVGELKTTAAAPVSTASFGDRRKPAPYTPPVSNPVPAGYAPVPGATDPIAGKANTAMILGIIGIVMGVVCGCLGLPCAIIAIVFGNQYKKAAETNPALLPELGKAKGAVIMGWIGIGLAVLMSLIGIAMRAAAGGMQVPTQ